MIREEINRTPGFRELTVSQAFPANVDAEKAILGSMLLGDTTSIADVEADCFSLESHRRIWKAIGELVHSCKPVDIVMLKEKLGESVKEIGGVSYLASLTEGLPRQPKVSEYISIVREKAKLRRIIVACEEAIEKCVAQTASAAEIVSGMGVALKGIRGQK